MCLDIYEKLKYSPFQVETSCGLDTFNNPVSLSILVGSSIELFTHKKGEVPTFLDNKICIYLRVQSSHR